MPELPEVETVRRGLEKEVLHKVIRNVEIHYENIIVTNLNDFKKNIVNEEIVNITRQGKLLIFELTHYYLVIHLRMEGKFFIREKSEPVSKHEHVIFYFDDFTLRYHDTRKFGKMFLVDKDKLYTDTPLSHMGLEPIKDKITVDYLRDKYNSNNHIKTLLLNQDIIAGIGNIYADEILFRSKINPNKKGKELNNKELQDIIKNTEIILNEAIKNNGTTIHSFESLGIKGNYQNYLQVHTKVGEKCPNCSTIIKKTRVNGRGTYYCPRCQKGD